MIGNLATHRHGRTHERLSDVRSPHLSVKEFRHLLIPVCHLQGEVLQHPTCDGVGVKPCHDVRINQQASRSSLDRHFPICYKLGKQHLPSTQGIRNLLTHPHSSRHCTFLGEHRNPCPTLHFKGLDEDQQNPDLPSSASFSHENSHSKATKALGAQIRTCYLENILLKRPGLEPGRSTSSSSTYLTLTLPSLVSAFNS